MIKSIPRFADSPRDSTNKLPNDVGAGPLRGLGLGTIGPAPPLIVVLTLPLALSISVILFDTLFF